MNSALTYTKPKLIVHSTEALEIPLRIGKTLYEASNKNKTEFWITDGKHCNTIFEDTSEYLNKVNALLIN